LQTKLDDFEPPTSVSIKDGGMERSALSAIDFILNPEEEKRLNAKGDRAAAEILEENARLIGGPTTAAAAATKTRNLARHTSFQMSSDAFPNDGDDDIDSSLLGHSEEPRRQTKVVATVAAATNDSDLVDVYGSGEVFSKLRCQPQTPSVPIVVCNDSRALRRRSLQYSAASVQVPSSSGAKYTRIARKSPSCIVMLQEYSKSIHNVSLEQAQNRVFSWRGMLLNYIQSLDNIVLVARRLGCQHIANLVDGGVSVAGTGNSAEQTATTASPKETDPEVDIENAEIDLAGAESSSGLEIPPEYDDTMPEPLIYLENEARDEAQVKIYTRRGILQHWRDCIRGIFANNDNLSCAIWIADKLGCQDIGSILSKGERHTAWFYKHLDRFVKARAVGTASVRVSLAERGPIAHVITDECAGVAPPQIDHGVLDTTILLEMGDIDAHLAPKFGDMIDAEQRENINVQLDSWVDAAVRGFNNNKNIWSLAVRLGCLNVAAVISRSINGVAQAEYDEKKITMTERLGVGARLLRDWDELILVKEKSRHDLNEDELMRAKARPRDDPVPESEQQSPDDLREAAKHKEPNKPFLPNLPIDFREELCRVWRTMAVTLVKHPCTAPSIADAMGFNAVAAQLNLYREERMKNFRKDFVGKK
jgi:hypothetical protein